jgi:hypothetical protein
MKDTIYFSSRGHFQRRLRLCRRADLVVPVASRAANTSRANRPGESSRYSLGSMPMSRVNPNLTRVNPNPTRVKDLDPTR